MTTPKEGWWLAIPPNSFNLLYIIILPIQIQCILFRGQSHNIETRNSDPIWVMTHDPSYLVGGWTTHLKNMLVKLDHETPRNRGEHKNMWVATT